MQRTLKIYNYINYALIALTAMVWYIAYENNTYSFLVAGIGTLILLTIANNSDKYRWTVFAVFTLVLATDAYVGLTFGFGYFLSMVLLLAIFAPPARFFNGIIYGYWLTLLVLFLLSFKQYTEFGGTLDSLLYEISAFIATNFIGILFIVGYITSVIPLYIARSKPSETLFYFLTGLIVFVISLPLQVLGSILVGIYFHLKSAFIIYKNTFQSYRNTDPKTNDQAAYEIYWFSKAFKDWRYIFSAVRTANKEQYDHFKISRERLRLNYGILLGGIPIVFLYLTGISTVLFGFILLIVQSIIHLLLVLTIGLPFYLYYLVFHLYDRRHLRSNKVATICPRCYHTTELPIYICHNCQSEHTNLRPGRFGIRKRKCSCGSKLPTTTLDNRHKLAAKCQNQACQQALFTEENSPITIPVIGGPSSGKTAFMLATMEQLHDLTNTGEIEGLQYLIKQDKTYLEQGISALKQGQFPNKTSKEQPAALNIRLTHSTWKNPKLLYLYDPAGEIYENRRELRNHHYLNDASAYVLMIDPFSLAGAQGKYRDDNAELATVKPSSSLPEDIVNMLLIHLTNENKVDITATVDTPLAIVLNKVDAFQVEHEITKINIESDSKEAMDDARRVHEQCKAYLINNGYRHLVKQIETKFTSYQFFLSSSELSHPKARSYQKEITNWLLDKTS